MYFETNFRYRLSAWAIVEVRLDCDGDVLIAD